MTTRPLLLSALLASAALVGCEVDTTQFQLPSQVCVSGATQLCACAGGTQGAQQCVADGTGWGACDCSTPPKVGGVTVSLQDASAVVVPALVAVHTVGVTDCLQPLGTVTATNDGAEAAALAFAVRDGVPGIVLSPPSPVAIGGGAAQTVAVDFDCSRLTGPPSDIATTVDITAGGAASGGISFPVSVTFKQGNGPGPLTVTLLDPAGGVVQELFGEHDPAVTDCRQRLGTIRVDNAVGEGGNLVITQLGEPVPTLELDPPGPTPLGNGASQDVAVFFDCEQLTAEPADFAVDLEVKLELASGGPSSVVPVRWDYLEAVIALADAAGAPATSIVATHEPGVTDCRQLLGSVTVRSNTGRSAEVSITGGEGDATLEVDPSRMQGLGAYESYTAQIFFNCEKLTAAPQDFTYPMTVSVVEAGGGPPLAEPLTFDLTWDLIEP